MKMKAKSETTEETIPKVNILVSNFLQEKTLIMYSFLFLFVIG